MSNNNHNIISNVLFLMTTTTTTSTVMIGFLAFFAIVMTIIAAVVAVIFYSKQKKKVIATNTAIQNDYEKLKCDLEDLERLSSNKRAELTSLIEDFGKEIDQLNEIIKEKEELKNSINSTNVLLNAEVEKKKLEKIEIEQQLANFTTTKKLLSCDVSELETAKTKLSTSIEEKERVYKKVCSDLIGDTAKLEVLNKSIEKMAAQKSTIEEEIKNKWIIKTSLEGEVEKMNAILAEKDKIIGELEVLKTTHKEAVLRNSEKDGAILFVNQKNFLPIDEGRWAPFNKLIEELKEKYPEIKEDLAKIQWSKVYLPAFQKMCKVLEADEGGIYKISIKGDENRCYVGKAQTSIKDRWYTHAKKMLGVESKGGEWLYNSGLKPEELVWEVLEKGKEKLDERERYWIEFFGCLEVGLNRI